jgi:hypothetical protein
MKTIIVILASFLLAGELQVDGDLKVSGTVDAQGNTITNVGAPQTLTDAVNAGILASALSDDGVYEYLIYYTAFWPGYFWGEEWNFRHSKYVSVDGSETGDNWQTKLNTLASQGYMISNVIQYDGTQEKVWPEYQNMNGKIILFILKRPISTND